MLLPATVMTFGNIKTDESKKIIATVGYEYESVGQNSARRYQIQPGISIRPLSALKLGVTANYSENHDDLQYVAYRNSIFGNRYILGNIDQQTLGLTFRVDINISPEFSIQYYGSPFVSKGVFSDFKHTTNPMAGEYNDRFSAYSHALQSGDYYGFDEDDDMLIDYSIANPDFNFYQFRSNLVAKWEYRLGSFIYFVWSSDRTGSTSYGKAPLTDSFTKLSKAFPNSIFLIKFNYWFTL
jgi:hypothetical protein